MNFNKVLVAEDTDSNNFGVVTKLKSIGVHTIGQSQYCDDALLKIKKAQFDKQPYQLLISDLSFVNPHRKSKLKSGEALIKAAKKAQPDLKVVVFSVIDKRSTIQNLMEKQGVDGYVCKGLNGLKELENALNTLFIDQRFTCPVATAVLSQKNVLELSDYEQQLLRLLANGFKQSEISAHFKANGTNPNSIRSIEANVSKLRDTFDAKNSHQLVHMATSLGLI